MSDHQTTMRAGRFELVDAQGVTRALLATGGDGTPQLRMYGSDGGQRAAVIAADDWGSFSVGQPQNMRCSLGYLTDLDGRSTSSVMLLSANQNMSIEARVRDDLAEVSIASEHWERVALAFEQGVPSITLKGEGLEFQVKVEADIPNECLHLRIYRGQLVTTLRLTLDDGANPQLTVVERDRNFFERSGS